MNAEHKITGELFEMEHIVHRDHNNAHTIKQRGLPRPARQSPKELPTGCPATCKCATGARANGGLSLNSAGYCEHICSKPYGGARYCGQGSSYTIGDFVDCTGCGGQVQGSDADYGSEAARASTTAGGSQIVPQGDAESNGQVVMPEWAIWLIGVGFTVMLAIIVALLYVISTRKNPASEIVLSQETVDERKRAESVEVIHIMGGGSLISKESMDSKEVSAGAPAKSPPGSIEARGVICLD